MSSRDRILAAIDGSGPGHLPLATWCFGMPAPPSLAWETGGRPVPHWYSMRMEHIHTLPEPWTLEDDFRRALAWQSLGVDDLLDVSVPWGIDPEVSWEDSVLPAAEAGAPPVMVRQYDTPAGPLRHAVRKTGESQGPGWVVQPDCVPLIEDMNIPRATEQAVAGPADVPAIAHLYQPPGEAQRQWFEARMQRVGPFAREHGLAVQAWSAFGMDAAVWLCGTEGAIMLALDEPEAFEALLETISRADVARTELAAAHADVDILAQRGWYSSTDFWSPTLFDRFVYPYLERAVGAAHSAGKKFAYVMTTGVETLGPRLADAGVDLIYFADPVQDGLSPERARELFGGRIALAGGVNSLTLAGGDARRIRDDVHRAMDVLGPGGRFILQPVDALFPDTPWEGVETMIEAWKEHL